MRLFKRLSTKLFAGKNYADKGIAPTPTTEWFTLDQSLLDSDAMIDE